MPHAIELDAAASIELEVSRTPALAIANTGTMTKLDQGCSRCSSRSNGPVAEPAAPGVSRASTTPAMVA